MDWQYTTDAVGNVLEIADQINPVRGRAYDYQDYQYYLIAGVGPWGALSWTYDQSGNRLAETRDGSSIRYAYSSNATGKNLSKLVSTTGGAGDNTFNLYSYDAAGNLVYKNFGDSKARYRFNSAGRLSEMLRDGANKAPSRTQLNYDGRSYLRRSMLTPFLGAQVQDWVTRATYSSEGLLYHRSIERHPTPASPRDAPITEEDDYLFYFAGRPVAQLTSAGALVYLVADHLGTPVLATDEAGGVEWQDGFEPFGAVYSDALAVGVFLRFPGQWEDVTWAESTPGARAFYNVHRWYEPDEGHYITPDPFQQTLLAFEFGIILQLGNLYSYALQRPLVLVDPLGLVAGGSCVARWIAGGAAVGAGIGATTGAVAAAVSASTSCSFFAPGVGTLGCGIGGASAGATPGAKIGGAVGATAGFLVGTLVCQCEDDPPLMPPEPDPRTNEIDCKKVKEYCIAKCTAETLPTYEPGGDPFFLCLRQCKESFGC